MKQRVFLTQHSNDKKTKQALPMAGRLYALFLFTVYKKRKMLHYELNGNSVSSNCKMFANQMFRNAFMDARHRLYDILGGSYKYSSKLIDYEFVYNSYRARNKTGVIHNNNYYNEQIPDTERIHPKTKRDKIKTVKYNQQRTRKTQIVKHRRQKGVVTNSSNKNKKKVTKASTKKY